MLDIISIAIFSIAVILSIFVILIIGLSVDKSYNGRKIEYREQIIFLEYKN